MISTIQSDLDCIREQDLSLWEGLRGKRIFATGCTGFVGSWFVHSFNDINTKLNLGASLTLLSRNKAGVAEKFPGIKLDVIEGNILDFNFPDGRFDLVIHGATEVAAYQSGKNPVDLLDVSYAGTKRVIDFAKASGVQKTLFLSSGAVYGKTPATLELIGEDHSSAPATDDVNGFYGEGKRLAEMLLFSSLDTVSARIFASCGPFLPMDSEFAFSHFLKAALKNEDIIIKGNGKTVRSYLYGSDLTIWLWTILLRGLKGRAYNVGSERAVSIKELAETIIRCTDTKSKMQVLGVGDKFERYIPSNARAKQELGLKELIPLEGAIKKSFDFHKGKL
jgi:dTDP-glucose 4,6-dehydratase